MRFFTLGRRNGRTARANHVWISLGSSMGAIAMIVFIIAGGGVPKQVLVNGCRRHYIFTLNDRNTLSPLLMCWTVGKTVAYRSGLCHRHAAITTAGVVFADYPACRTDPLLKPVLAQQLRRPRRRDRVTRKRLASGYLKGYLQSDG
ncbi:hypothetical protein E0I56_021485, partial [Escherichia coli]|nr:hypothetical protein [Escherichia coli]